MSVGGGGRDDDRRYFWRAVGSPRNPKGGQAGDGEPGAQLLFCG